MDCDAGPKKLVFESPSLPAIFTSAWIALTEATQRIQRPGVSHPWQQLRDDIKQHVSAVAKIQIASHMPLDLRFHATQGNQNRECNELPDFSVEAGPGVVIAEAIGRQKPLNV
jgi:hypothetical protein